MLVSQDLNYSKYQIQSYDTQKSQAKITINHHIYTHSVLIHNNELIVPWRPQCFSELTLEDFEMIYLNPPAVLLLGTGIEFHIPSMELLRPLFEKGIGIEFMDSAAACRTYSVLTAQDTKVSLALIIN